MNELFKQIEAFDTITIFRHVSADFDALGSQFGLKQWIQDTYPEKKVYALGQEVGPSAACFPPIDEVDDKQIASSLAIILDTANAERIDDSRWRNAKFKIKVDHHIFVDQYADVEYIEDRKGATCEILASAFQQRNEKLSKTCATYLYRGLIADTLQFSIAATTPEMLHTAAYLVGFGIDVAKINEQNFSKSFKEFQYETYIREHFEFYKESIAYAIIHKEDYEQFQLTFQEAKEKVYALSRVKEFQVWALFIENGQDEKGILYNGSLRSKTTTINAIANKYNGGGHRFACGVKGLHKEQIQNLLDDLYEAIIK